MGRVLGDRYRLIRPLGSGASAHVYVAEDVSLRRRVAVKVLHPGLAEDEAFLRRFRAEARVVAALRHPHVLRIYDWGDDGDSPYLVTELLEGGSLRSLLDRGGLLTPAQAAQVGAQAASALAHAHQRGLVHRDVKPANLLFDDEGRVSVADFGLARALAEATWTEPAGAIVGTARYAAPEQVQGRPLDDRADVYALAIVVVEATTGVVPFAADTMIGTLMARVGRVLELPATLGPLAAVLVAAGAPEPADRPDAGGLATALRRVVAELPPPAPLPLAPPLVDGDVEIDQDPTLVAGRTGPDRRGRRVGDPGSVHADRYAPPAEPALRTATRPSGGPGAGAGEGDGHGAGAGDPVPDPAADPAPDPRRPASVLDLTALDVPSRPAPPAGLIPPAAAPLAAAAAPSLAATPPPAQRRRVALLAGGLVLLLVAGGAAGAWLLTRQPPLVAVPPLQGSTAVRARTVLGQRHLRLVVAGRSYDATVPAGAVVSQVPRGGKERRGMTVAVTLSKGPAPVPVPPVARQPQAEAEALLKAAGLVTGKVTRATSITVPSGDVISAAPSHGELRPRTPVALVVSKGKPLVTVPKLQGADVQSYAAAAAALRADHLAPAEELVYNNTVAAGLVVWTDPAPGARITYGSPVTVEVSKGPHMVTVPNVAGESVSAATARLQGSGLAVSGVQGNPTASVTGTSPGSGQSVRYGSSVQLITG